MTDKEYLQELEERISAQMDLINRYTSGRGFAPDFYYEELNEMCKKRDELRRKLANR